MAGNEDGDTDDNHNGGYAAERHTPERGVFYRQEQKVRNSTQPVPALLSSNDTRSHCKEKQLLSVLSTVRDESTVVLKHNSCLKASKCDSELRM